MIGAYNIFDQVSQAKSWLFPGPAPKAADDIELTTNGADVTWSRESNPGYSCPGIEEIRCHCACPESHRHLRIILAASIMAIGLIISTGSLVSRENCLKAIRRLVVLWLTILVVIISLAEENHPGLVKLTQDLIKSFEEVTYSAIIKGLFISLSYGGSSMLLKGLKWLVSWVAEYYLESMAARSPQPRQITGGTPAKPVAPIIRPSELELISRDEMETSQVPRGEFFVNIVDENGKMKKIRCQGSDPNVSAVQR